MIHLAFALAAAEKTAEASYAIYLYCAGGVLAGGAAVGGGVWFFAPKNQTQPPENAPEDIVVAIPEEVPDHQEELRENAGLVHLNIMQANEVIEARRLAQQGDIEEGIHSFRQSANQHIEATIQLNDIVQHFERIRNNAELDAETRQCETDQLLHALASPLDALNQSSARLAAQERKLQRRIDHLTHAIAQSSEQLNEANQEIQQLRALHHHAHDAMRDKETADLKSQNHKLSMKNTELSACLLMAMQHHKPQEKPMMAYSPDSVATGHELSYFRR